MQEKEWHRTFVIGVVVAIFFFGWWLRGFLYNWKFRLFSLKSWGYMLHEVEAGWEPSSTSDWIFLITLCAAVPLFLYLWYLCTKVRWRKLVKKIWRAIVDFFSWLFGGQKKRRKKRVLAPPPPFVPVVVTSVQSPARPRPISFSTQTVEPVPMTFSVENEARPTFTVGVAPTAESYRPDSGENWGPGKLDGDVANLPLEDIELPQREAVKEDIPALLEKAGYQLIPDVRTSLQHLDFLAVGADRIYAILVDREEGDWLAEEEPFNGEAPLWFSEVDHRVSPIYELRQSVEEIQNKISDQLPDIKICPFLIEAKGNIINAEEMIKIWKELEVNISRTDVGGTEDLLLTSEVIETTQPASMSEIEIITRIFKGES